jgi:hypothetical protein
MGDQPQRNQNLLRIQQRDNLRMEMERRKKISMLSEGGFWRRRETSMLIQMMLVKMRAARRTGSIPRMLR